ncbi:MAG: hypothetical protein QGF00_29725 [Planctomycetota bacterium]|jgi:hypothetical protein|nr:hypothetical protein [Planctomycetota bacterium]MDP7253817.1 hypothetical protein [Planctomycetota bacterium]
MAIPEEANDLLRPINNHMEHVGNIPAHHGHIQHLNIDNRGKVSSESDLLTVISPELELCLEDNRTDCPTETTQGFLP